MRLIRIPAVFLVAIVLSSTTMPIAFSLPPLENGVTFPVGTLVIPMDEKQADRILVFGLVHALLRSPNPIQIFRVIEPPDVTLPTNLTAAPKAFAGGPFLVYPSDAGKVIQVKSRPEFKQVTVGTLTVQQSLNNIFRVTDPTKILVIKGLWGRTDITLDTMKIPYNITTRETAAANPSMIFDYTLIVVDCFGWFGNIPAQLADNIRTHVSKGNEVIFTDIAIRDLDKTFPGYLTLFSPQANDKVTSAYAYNPPRKYDLTKFGSTADVFAPEFPSQYYNPPPAPNELKFLVPAKGTVVASVASNKVNDVRILADSKTLGVANNEYGILAFYFEYGEGIAEGLAVHPQEQTRSLVGDKGYFAVHQLYGNKFVHGPPSRNFGLEANPPSATTPQGTSISFTITVRSFGAFNNPVTLSVAGLPPSATGTFNPPAPQPPAGGIATSTFTVNVPLATPNGTYTMNVTGTTPLLPPITKWVLINLTVTLAPADFQIAVSPNSLTINASESKTAIVTVTSIGLFNQNVTLNVTGLPAHVTATFTPPAPKPPPGSTASSIMRISVGADAINGTYPLTITGTNGTRTKSVPFTLTIVKKAVPGIPLLTLLLILLLAILGVFLGLLALYLSSRKRKPPAAPPPVAPAVPGRPQRMYVVPAAAQRIVCARCGRPIPVEAVYCPYCRQRRAAPTGGPVTVPRAATRMVFPARRAVWAFVLAMVSSILILINAAALLSPGFWGPPTNWSGIFWWLGGSSGLGQSIAVFIGLIAGFTIMTGGIMMVMRRGVIGAVITFPFAVLSIIIGGGFLAGAVLGIVAGILGVLGR